MAEELSKHTLNLYTGDYERLREMYPDVGAGAIIRRLVRGYIEKIEQTGVTVAPEAEVKI